MNGFVSTHVSNVRGWVARGFFQRLRQLRAGQKFSLDLTSYPAAARHHNAALAIFSADGGFVRVDSAVYLPGLGLNASRRRDSMNHAVF
jgi:hypothetical protein